MDELITAFIPIIEFDSKGRPTAVTGSKRVSMTEQQYSNCPVALLDPYDVSNPYNLAVINGERRKLGLPIIRVKNG